MNVVPVDPQTQREVLATFEEMTRAERLVALVAENARLRAFLRVHTVAGKLRLSPSEAQVVLALYDAAKSLTGPRILKITPAIWRGAKSNVATMCVLRIRQKLGAETIETVSTGYQLSDAARARVQIVLEDAP